MFAKRPFGHPKAVQEYLNRYTHMVAISNHRILDIDQKQTTSSYKDYHQRAQTMEMNLDNLEFIRRFSMHDLSPIIGILPRGLVRIRHFGILGSSIRAMSIELIHRQLEITLPEIELRILEVQNPRYGAYCDRETMVSIQQIPKQGSPKAVFSSYPPEQLHLYLG